MFSYYRITQVLIAAHGNSLRALVKHLDNLRFFSFSVFFSCFPLCFLILCVHAQRRGDMRAQCFSFFFLFSLSFLGDVCWYSDEEICGLIMLTFSSLFFFFSCVFFMWTDTATRRSGTQYSQIFFSIFFFNSLFLVVCAGTATRRSAG